MSIFVCICKGDYDALMSWPFGHRLVFSVLDQNEIVENRKHINYIIKPNVCKENRAFVGRPISDRNASFGAQRFVELDLLETGQYIANDTIYIKLDVEHDNIDIA